KELIEVLIDIISVERKTIVAGGVCRGCQHWSRRIAHNPQHHGDVSNAISQGICHPATYLIDCPSFKLGHLIAHQVGEYPSCGNCFEAGWWYSRYRVITARLQVIEVV